MVDPRLGPRGRDALADLRDWALKGWVSRRQTDVEKLWVLWADEEEVERLQRLRSAHTRVFLAYPKELTTPKRRLLSR